MGAALFQFAPGSVVKSIQRGTVTIAGNASVGNATISAVDPAKTEVRFLGTHISAAGGNVSLKSLPAILLTSGTNVRAQRYYQNEDPMIVSFEITEFF